MYLYSQREVFGRTGTIPEEGKAGKYKMINQEKKINYSVVIVTYNRCALLRECIACVLGQTIQPGHVVIVNNASSDDTGEVLDALAAGTPALVPLHLTENCGGAGGFYAGLSKAHELGDDWHIIIDDDAMLKPDFAQRLLENTQKFPEVRAFAGTVVEDGRIARMHRQRVQRPGYRFCSIPETAYENESFVCDTASFCGLMIKDSLIEQIGLPERAYFIWYDDTEYCLRIRRVSEIRVIPGAVLQHKVSGVAGEWPRHYTWKDYYGIRNRIWMVQKHGSTLDRIFLRIYLGLHMGVRNRIFGWIHLHGSDWKQERMIYRRAVRDASGLNAQGINTFNNKKTGLNYIYLSPSHGGGKDQVAFNLLSGLVENGYGGRLIVICYDYLTEKIKSISPELEIVSLPYRGGSSEFSRLLRITLDNTFKVPEIIRKNNIGVLFHANAANGLRRQKIPSVVVPHDIKAVSHRRMGKVEVCLWKHLLYRAMYGMDFRHADRIIAISEMDREEIASHYKKYAEKVVRIYNPIHVHKEEYTGTSEQKDIIAINLQFHHKNIITLIKAFEQIKDRIPGNLVLIGKVPARVHYLKEYVESHGLCDRVEFTGFLTGKEKRKRLLSGALYVNCSLFEGFGMTTVEAMILKVPALVSKVAANYEVTKGLCYYYEPVDDENALAKALERALTQPEPAALRAEKSRIMAEAYDYRKIADVYMQLFEELQSGSEREAYIALNAPGK